MTRSFMLSLDCEGKWGMSDDLTDMHHSLITDRQLDHVYRSIFREDDTRQIPATFAVVGLFVGGPDAVRDHGDSSASMEINWDELSGLSSIHATLSSSR